jgi:hypothetical protein
LGELEVDRAAHPERGVLAVAVVVIDPGRHLCRAWVLVAKCSRWRSSKVEVECQDSIAALSSADPGRPMDWVMPSRVQASWKAQSAWATFESFEETWAAL